MSTAAALPDRAEGRTLAEIGWASGSMGVAALYNVMALFGLFFMTTFLGIAPAVAGALLFFSKIYDALIHPMVGAMSDRTRHRWGPRRIWLLVGAFLVGGSFALFLNQPAIDDGGPLSILLSVALLMLFSTGYSVFSVPYSAMPPDIAATYDQRTRLMSFRVFFMIAGVLVGSAIAPVLVQRAGGGIEAYAMVGLALGLFATVMCLVAFVSAAGLPTGHVAAPSRAMLTGPYREFWSVFGNAAFRTLTIVKLCQLAILSTLQACIPYFFAFVLHLTTGDIGKYLGASTAAGLVFIPIHRQLIARLGKRRAYKGLLIAYSFVLASWALWSTGEPIAFFYIRAVVSGILSTGTLLCVLSMLPDTMEYDRLVSGRQRAGVISGAFTLVETLAGAFGPLAIGVLLQVSGLEKSRNPGTVQPESALVAIQLGVSLVPVMFCLLALWFLRGYRLDAEALERARQ